MLKFRLKRLLLLLELELRRKHGVVLVRLVDHHDRTFFYRHPVVRYDEFYLISWLLSLFLKLLGDNRLLHVELREF
jgi:hypothetical protein